MMQQFAWHRPPWQIARAQNQNSVAGKYPIAPDQALGCLGVFIPQTHDPKFLKNPFTSRALDPKGAHLAVQIKAAVQGTEINVEALGRLSTPDQFASIRNVAAGSRPSDDGRSRRRTNFNRTYPLRRIRSIRLPVGHLRSVLRSVRGDHRCLYRHLLFCLADIEPRPMRSAL